MYFSLILLTAILGAINSCSPISGRWLLGDGPGSSSLDTLPIPLNSPGLSPWDDFVASAEGIASEPPLSDSTFAVSGTGNMASISDLAVGFTPSHQQKDELNARLLLKERTPFEVTCPKSEEKPFCCYNAMRGECISCRQHPPIKNRHLNTQANPPTKSTVTFLMKNAK